MRHPIALAQAALAFALAGPPVLAQQIPDVTAIDPEHHKVEFENDRVRVIRFVIAPHAKAPLHSHPAAVVVLLTDQDAKSTTQDGKTSQAYGKASSAKWRGPIVHAFENMSDQPIEGIVVEPKGRGNPAWTPPPRDSTKVDAAHQKVEFENDQVRIERSAFAKGERSPMHDHATNVQIALTDAHLRVTTPDGKTTESRAKKGEARYRTPLTHQVENLGDGIESLVVVLKGAPSVATPASR